MNSTFTNHEELDINSGVLIAIPKPGKPKGSPNNLRPKTLLNTLRKELSVITLDRIRPSIENTYHTVKAASGPSEVLLM